MNNGRLQLEFEMAQGFLRVHWTRLGCNGDLRARLELSFSSSLYFVPTPEKPFNALPHTCDDGGDSGGGVGH